VIRHLLDTCACIELIRGGRSSELLMARLRRKKVGTVGISAITLAELQYGVARSSAPARNRVALVEFLAPLVVAPFDDAAASAYGRLRAELQRAGRPIGPLDMLIAAHALSLSAVLVTGNEREFRRVTGLTIENWLTK
jgi:tRNA(fMet)-specific endonuclease VapC